MTDQLSPRPFESISLENGKYTVVWDRDGSFYALRYGQPWRDLTGDKLVFVMMQRIAQLEATKDD